MSSPTLGLIVNPIAGMGGAVALKGTDAVVDEARARGAEPIAHHRAMRLLAALPSSLDVAVLTCTGAMGADACAAAGRQAQPLVEVADPTRAEDTKRAARALVAAGVDLMVFVGGDGTAHDVADAVGHDVPVLGVPSGVKMNSGVFAETPEAAARTVADFLGDRVDAELREVVEVDEAAMRRSELVPARLASLLVPVTDAVAPSKAEPGGSTEGVVEAVEELAVPGARLVLGPGTTLHAAKKALMGDTAGTLLGFDVVDVGDDGVATAVVTDATRAELDALALDRSRTWLVLTPIGAQGFVLGRGNQQVSPALVARLGWDRLVVVATPDKLAGLEALRMDTGDPGLDREVPAHVAVVTGPGFRRLVRVRGASDALDP